MAAGGAGAAVGAGAATVDGAGAGVGAGAFSPPPQADNMTAAHERTASWLMRDMRVSSWFRCGSAA
jgi:hypothetical protein